MKKLDSNHAKESLREELKRLRKENKKLASQKDKLKAKYDKAQKDLKKKDVRKITLTEEQSRLLSNLFPDIDSLL
jgi:predicted nuclease with TOPRIM domain